MLFEMISVKPVKVASRWINGLRAQKMRKLKGDDLLCIFLMHIELLS